jgi:hypothetical protein
MIIETTKIKGMGIIPKRTYTEEEFGNSIYATWLKVALLQPVTPPLSKLSVTFGTVTYTFTRKP